VLQILVLGSLLLQYVQIIKLMEDHVFGLELFVKINYALMLLIQLLKTVIVILSYLDVYFLVKDVLILLQVVHPILEIQHLVQNL
jgi:hypothetical protein